MGRESDFWDIQIESAKRLATEQLREQVARADKAEIERNTASVIHDATVSELGKRGLPRLKGIES